jgi:hypothetical protein
MMRKITLLSLLFLLGYSLLHGQDNKRKPGDLLQFSGVVVSGDSLQPVPFTAITVTGRRYHRILGYWFPEIDLYSTR